jgi:hypothetical protein
MDNVTVPAGPVRRAAKRLVEPLFAFVDMFGRDDRPAPGWMCFGTDEHGQKLYGYVGAPTNPHWTIPTGPEEPVRRDLWQPDPDGRLE